MPGGAAQRAADSVPVARLRAARPLRAPIVCRRGGGAVARARDAVTDMAYPPAADQPPVQLCRDAVLTADVYVLLCGFRYSSPVRDQPDLCYTSWSTTPPTRGSLGWCSCSTRTHRHRNHGGPRAVGRSQKGECWDTQ